MLTTYPPDFEQRYLSGRELWGDDFDEDEIREWFAAEENAYAEIGDFSYDGVTDTDHVGYAYSELMWWHGWRHIPVSRRFEHVLGIGSAHGGELLPVADRADRISIVEPSERLQIARIRGRPVGHVRPDPTGAIALDDGTVDLITCFGVLHHIPNVSTTVREIGRLTMPAAIVLIREPIGSMGDWRYPRKPGITPRERGIPPKLLAAMAEDAGFRVRWEYCAFPLTRRIKVGHRWAYRSKTGVAIDRALSILTAPNYRYNPTRPWHKIAPSAAFYFLERT